VKQPWEYRVEHVGGALRGVRTEEIEALLNEAALEGWEPILTETQSNSNRMWIILRRPRDTRSRDRSHTWP
jgi:hypothetical protein